MTRSASPWRNTSVRGCFILVLIAPAFAASPEAVPATRVKTVVRADAKSGRLVRTFLADPVAARFAPRIDKRELDEMVNQIAAEEGVETPLVRSVILAESNYDPNAVSPKGALGVMQLIPSTARRFGVSDVFNPQENIRGGVRYLHFLLDYYKGDYTRAVAAYNAGEAAVDRYHGVPPYAETRHYVAEVAHHLEAARHAPALIDSPAVLPDAETFSPIQTSTGSDGRVYYRTP